MSIEESTRVIIESTEAIYAGFNARLGALEQALTPNLSAPASYKRIPDAAVIEIVERRTNPLTGPGVIVPNEVRINGIPLLIADQPVTVHEISTSPTDAVMVTLTLLARRVVISEELVEPEDQ